MTPGSKKKKFNRLALPAFLWLALIWLLSSLPGRHLPSGKIVGLDKLAHITVYFILGVLVNRLLRGLKVSPRKVWWIYLVMVASAALDELHQFFIPQRSVTVWDFAANATGLGLAFAAYWIFRDRS
ncbi:MAG: VanZ family protein [Candidatus Cloacimonetes bacterium]|nr:VanZ family protein [Candidatus Cloacimonadota bacterium]